MKEVRVQPKFIIVPFNYDMGLDREGGGVGWGGGYWHTFVPGYSLKIQQSRFKEEGEDVKG